MTRFNRLLAGLAIAVLLVTVWLLGWLRQRAVADMDRAIASAAAGFRPDQIFHGPGGNALVRFELVEQLIGNTLRGGYVRGAIMTRIIQRDGGPVELTLAPFSLAALEGADWKRRVTDWRREPLGDPGAPFGYLYLDLDRTIVTRINWAIGGLGLAIALVLILLLARLLSQETSLTRTTIELNERRRELIRLERLALAGQLAAGLLHDLRKPVLHAEHAVEDLAEALGDFAGASPALLDIRRQTRLFFQMLSDSQFERFVQSDRASEEYVDILPMLEQSLALVGYERRGVEVLINDQPTPPLLAHPYRLVQLFSNIILNAYQALAGRGKLAIELKTETNRDQPGIYISFTDDGPGIALETLPHLFEPFFTTKPEGQGTGLGLSICNLIVEDFGGKIVVDSRPGGPTTFKIWLPTES